VRRSTVAGRAVPLTACSGNSSGKRSFLLHRAVIERYRISIVLENTCFDDGIKSEDAKMMEDGAGRIVCDGNHGRSRQENGKIERGQEYRT